MTTRHVRQREMTDDQRSIFAAWMVYHDINLAEARVLEFTRDGYVRVFYREGVDALIPVELEIPAWL